VNSRGGSPGGLLDDFGGDDGINTSAVKDSMEVAMDYVFVKDGHKVASEIKIRWDGDIPGVEQHRLSIGAFGEALSQLLFALRRIATQMVTTAVEPERPATGRFANLARGLDIEITSIEGGSSGFDGLVTFMQPPDELPLFADLPRRATFELLDSIDRESKQQPSNWAVRKYLTLLPPGLHHHIYEVYDDGAATPTKRIEVGDVKLPEVPEEFPFIREVIGDVVGVGFDPGRSEVRVKGDGPLALFDADAAQVETALELRHQKVRSLGVHAGKHTRLLRINRVTEPRFEATDEMIEEHIFKRWNGVFARLAK
jgi:hypothetical protein